MGNVMDKGVRRGIILVIVAVCLVYLRFSGFNEKPSTLTLGGIESSQGLEATNNDNDRGFFDSIFGSIILLLAPFLIFLTYPKRNDEYIFFAYMIALVIIINVVYFSF